MQSFWDTLWHDWLRRPYRLYYEHTGSGTPVVLLHGIGRSHVIWSNLVQLLGQHEFKVIAFDLLGFGQSPKPDSLDYDADDHVRALAASIKSLRLGQPAIIVGHSMGCLVAVRLAAQYPELVRHMILYEMPLYDGLPEKRHYRVRLEFYRRLYARIAAYQPQFDLTKPPLRDKAFKAIVGKDLTAETWSAYVKSLQHTIVEQQTSQDIKRIGVPMEVIYGALDMLVIRGKVQTMLGHDVSNITAHTLRERHKVSKKASMFLAERIIAAQEQATRND